MNEKAIRILIADSEGSTGDSICVFLKGDVGYEVVGRAADSGECLSMALIKHPDIAIIHSGLKPMSAIEVCEQLSQQSPSTSVIMVLAVGFEENLFHRMMSAGVADFLISPLQRDQTLREIHTVVEKRAARRQSAEGAPRPEEKQKVIAIVGCRGGGGRTTVAVNLSCALAAAAGEGASAGRVALVDTNMPASDVAIFLDVEPRRTLADVLPQGMTVDRDVLESLLEGHSSGVMLLAAAGIGPHEWSYLPRNALISILAQLRSRFPFTVVDLADTVAETSRAVLDFCDDLVLVVGVDLPRLQAARLFLLRLLESNFPNEKVHVVLNDTGPESKNIETAQAEAILEFEVTARLPYDGHLVPAAINLGQPFVLSHPDKPVSRAVRELATKLGEGRLRASSRGRLFKSLGLNRTA
ncbi:MAG: MinD/ParA family protein [Verrucomicrobia bacterium]|nr:MinD/ParA family protein [Verrucomicrobiota bacterium]